MQRVLVLGGGGVIGIAWESGLIAGLRERSFDFDALDLVVGTSAGAIVASQLLGGTLDGAALAANGGNGPLIDPRRIDGRVVAQIFQKWGAMKGPTPEVAAEIGRLARGQNRAGEAGWVETMARVTRLDAWPDANLWICAVDTATGARRVLDRSSGAPIARAVAASAAIPGIFPSVAIDDALYMDGQVHSSTNADLLIEGRPEQVLIAMPTNELNAQSLGLHARRCVEIELELLAAVGCRVTLRTPSEEDVSKMGSNLMDARGVPAAYERGYATGLVWAAEL